MSLNDLRATWTTLYKHTLPSLAISKSSAQEHWPVHVDHCFARIILDAVIGIDTPWTSKLKPPAWKNMSVEQLRRAIEFGRRIAQGELDLAELDKESLALRGKLKNGGLQRKRKREQDSKNQKDNKDPAIKAEPEGPKAKVRRTRQSDIRSSIVRPKTIDWPEKQANLPSPPATPAPVDAELSDLIASSKLTPFRQRVLSALCQVPSGRFTTYAAMSDHLRSCPRAVGNALRNNPFAPRVPCHRVVASGGGIGGFGGEWGTQGKYAPEKLKLLKNEGVRVDRRSEKVLGQVWNGFI